MTFQLPNNAPQEPDNGPLSAKISPSPNINILQVPGGNYKRAVYSTTKLFIRVQWPDFASKVHSLFPISDNRLLCVTEKVDNILSQCQTDQMISLSGPSGIE